MACASAVVGDEGPSVVAAVGKGRVGYDVRRVGWALVVGVTLALGGRGAWGHGGARGVHRAPARNGLSAAQGSQAVLIVKGAGGWGLMHEAEYHLAAEAGAHWNHGRSAVQVREVGTVRVDGVNRVLRNTISRYETP